MMNGFISSRDIRLTFVQLFVEVIIIKPFEYHCWNVMNMAVVHIRN